MTSFEWYQFKDTGYDLTHLPKNSHLIIETTLYLYYVSADNNKQLWKYTKATGADEQLDVDPGDAWGGDDKSRPKNIVSIWHERGAVNKLYIVDSNWDHTNSHIFSLDFSDDSVVEILTIANAPVIWDVIYYDITAGVMVTLDDLVQPGRLLFYAVYWDAGLPGFNSDTLTLGAGTYDGTEECSFLVEVAADQFWFAFQNKATENVSLYRWRVDTDITAMEDCGAGTDIPSDRNLRGISYDGDDMLYFILDIAGTNFFYSYSIGTDTLTKSLEFDVSLMLDRNTLGTVGSPWEFEKAFHITSPYIYQIHRDYIYLLKLQDIGLTGGATIKAITDKYLIDSNKNVYEYTNLIADLPRARATYQIYKLPRAEIHYQTTLSTDQLIEIYEKDDSANRTKVFAGRAGMPMYNNKTAMYEFRMINFGNDDLTRKVSYSMANEYVSSAFINLINENSKFLYTDATAIPDISVSRTLTFDEQHLKNCFYTLSILANGYWTIEPDGYTYFRTYSNRVDSSTTINNSSNDNGPPKVFKLQNQFNTWSIEGGINLNTARPYGSVVTDDAHILQYGESVWNGKDVFPEARSQADLSHITVGLNNWQGMQDNPDNATFMYQDYYRKVGPKLNYQFSYLTELAVAQSMTVQKNLTNFKEPGLIVITTTTNLIRRTA